MSKHSVYFITAFDALTCASVNSVYLFYNAVLFALVIEQGRNVERRDRSDHIPKVATI